MMQPRVVEHVRQLVPIARRTLKRKANRGARLRGGLFAFLLSAQATAHCHFDQFLIG